MKSNKNEGKNENKKCVYIYIKWNYIVSERNWYKKKYGEGGAVW